MRTTPSLTLVIFLMVLMLAPTSLLRAQDSESKPEAKPIPPEVESVTQHTIRVNGQAISYTATAATIHLKNGDGDVTGSLYFTAYTIDGKDPNSRPLSFIYNGGPGSASMWLHMGAFGPKRVLVNDPDPTPPPPYDVEDNQGTILDVTDMVFIDPIGTGFSRVVGEGEGKEYWGIDEDAASLTQFITQYVTRNDRWNSPKFLIGESYGTTRNAVLVNRLQNQAGMHFNGVVMVSSVLDFETLRFDPGRDVSYVTFLPAYAITAAYHGVIEWPTDLTAWLSEVRAFATKEYALVLAQGASASEADVNAVRKRLAQYTGLSEDYLDRANLRVNAGQFRAELLRSRGRTVSRLDSRYDGYSNELLSESASYDAQSPAISGAYTAAINRYLREELKFETTDNYQVSGGTSNWNWSRGSGGGWLGSTNVAPDLEQAMIQNPNLKVQFENGYYDLATPFFATEWTTDHMILPDELRKNIKHNFYEAGHMMYALDKELLALKDNVTAFILSATKRP
ncbi:peptidase S10 [bacterium]|nr:peptidase S10 [bacterium]